MEMRNLKQMLGEKSVEVPDEEEKPVEGMETNDRMEEDRDGLQKTQKEQEEEPRDTRGKISPYT